VVRADSGFENHKLMRTLERQGVEFSIAVKQSKQAKALIDEIPERDWTVVEDYPDTGEAHLAETKLGNWRLIVRRTRLIGAQAELWPDWRYHCFLTKRTVPMRDADIDHRDHATVELVIRDLKHQALCHFPSGRFAANSAWTVIAALAHNLARWTTLIGLPNRPVQTAHARRRHLLAIPGRLTRTSRRWTLRLPAHWPWKTDFHTVLHAIRALPPEPEPAAAPSTTQPTPRPLPASSAHPKHPNALADTPTPLPSHRQRPPTRSHPTRTGPPPQTRVTPTPTRWIQA
jgi:hypothetical protein